MKSKYIVVFVSVILMLSCTNDKSKFTGKDIKIDLSHLKQNIKIDLSKLNYEIIDLETIDSSLIGNIDKISFVNNKIYILDREIAGAIFIFDKTGNFISKIDAAGQGPGEYVEIDDFIVDKQTDEIIVLDYDQSKIIYYLNYKSKKEIKIAHDFEYFTKFTDKIVGVNDYCYNKNGCHKILVFDENFQLLKQLIPTKNNSDKVSWDLRRTISENNDSLFITEAFSNYIYVIDSNFSMRPYYHINFGGDSLDIDKHKMNRDKFLKHIDNTRKAFLVDNFLEMGGIIYFEFFYKRKLVFCFSKSNESKVLCSNAIVDSEQKIALFPMYSNAKYMFFKVITIMNSDTADNKQSNKNTSILKIRISELEQLLF